MQELMRLGAVLVSHSQRQSHLSEPFIHVRELSYYVHKIHRKGTNAWMLVKHDMEASHLEHSSYDT